MKKILVILTMLCMTLSLFARSADVYCNGDYIGGVRSWITPDGYLKANNTANRKVTFEIYLDGIWIEFSVPGNAKEHNCGKVSKRQDQYTLKIKSCD